MIPSLENINWHDFLDRPTLAAPPSEVVASVAQHVVLITGAGGSIGSALAKRLMDHGAKLVLLESSESILFDLECELKEQEPRNSPVFYLGSAMNRGLLDEICALHAPRFVFHTAAFKHVPLLEEHPLAAIANNVFSTDAVMAAASGRNMRVILLSTDKAVKPASLMGATKRVAEQMVLTSGGIVLRLGNVLGSRGSVTEIFSRQIAAGRPLTVTDPAARRYFLTVSEAVNLLLRTSAEPHGTALFVPMLHKSHFIADLARFMMSVLAPEREIPIEFTHLRAGDKETEELWSAQEIARQTNVRDLLRVDTPMLSHGLLWNKLRALSEAVELRDVGTAISILCELVPDYTPGATIAGSRTPVEPPVHP